MAARSLKWRQSAFKNKEQAIRVTVIDNEDFPSVGREALVNVLGEGDGSVPINGNIYGISSIST